ncbi:MAG: large subunit ribosomal protein [Patescibacteria group bacterium]|nr:large subunit ribosomal protein [Patescibacteria group bacterium]
MDKVKLESKIRDVFGRKVKKGRKEGMVPGVVYGKETKPESIWVNSLDFSRLVKKSGESTVIELEVEGSKEKHNVLIYDIQNDPVSGNYLHVDFFKIRMDEEIETGVELVYVGESPAVKESGGMLVKNMDEIEVKCLPADLPSEIKVDISGLKTFDDYIYVKDLNVSGKVKIDLDPETVVALVMPPRSEEELGKLEEKVEADVTKVEGVVKETAPAEEEGKKGENKK